MADTELIDAVAKQLEQSNAPDVIIASLTAKGYAEADIRGALALLELQSLGQRTGNALLMSELSSVTSSSTPAQTSSTPLLMLFAVFMIVAGGGFLFFNPDSVSFLVNQMTPTTSPTVAVDTEVDHTYTHTYTFATSTARPAITSAPSKGNTTSPQPVVVSPLPTQGNISPVTPAAEPAAAGKTVVRLVLASGSVKSGGSTKLTWSSKNATSCSSTGFDIAGQSSGSVMVSAQERTKYVLTCVGPSGEVSDAETLFIDLAEPPPAEQVTQAPPPPADPLPPPTPTPEVPPPTPPADPLPPQEIPPVDPAPGRFAVYPGCEAPGQTFAREIYIDPVGGLDTGDGSKTAPLRTLTTALVSKKIRAGDHVVLLAGNYGSIRISDTSAPQLMNATVWTWFDFQPGAIGGATQIVQMSRVLLTGMEITSTGSGAQVWVNKGSNIVLADSSIYGAKSTSGWTADQWKAVAGGLMSDGTACVAFVGNSLKNVRSGIGVQKGGKTREENSARALVEGNTIRNVSGDGFVVNGSDIIVRDNKLYDEYVGQEHGDGNHDDALQVFALGGATFDNIRVEGNWFQETTDPNRPFISTLQGIALFDGLVTNMRVTDNVIISSHWHGISLYGVQNSIVDHNTVVNYTKNGRATWISVPLAKGDAWAPTGTRITNNIAVGYIGASGTTLINNQTVKDPVAVFKTFDTVNMKFDLHPKPGSVIDGTDTGAYPTKTASLKEKTGYFPMLAAAIEGFWSFLRMIVGSN